ncbi:MAG: class I SAM-dependent methyltransferase [Bryobacteraceae bacterium]
MTTGTEDRDYRIVRIVRWFRRRRMQRFEATFTITARTRVLDVGGTSMNWAYLSVRPRLVILNTGRERRDAESVTWVAGDGCSLPFPDAAFDIVFSNSVIEHVGSPERQRLFAGEIARVGRAYWVQTPNRWFPVEPHLLTPFLHWLPVSVRAWITRRFTVWQWVTRPAPDHREFYIEHFLDDIRLLGPAEMKGLFPGARLVRERLLGLTKSLVAVRMPR